MLEPYLYAKVKSSRRFSQLSTLSIVEESTERTNVVEAYREGLFDLINRTLAVSKLPSAERDGGHRMSYTK